MGIKQTHTYAKLELSSDAYDEIKEKLVRAGYQQAFINDGTIDMHGIGVTRGPALPSTNLNTAED